MQFEVALLADFVHEAYLNGEGELSGIVYVHRVTRVEASGPWEFPLRERYVTRETTCSGEATR